MRTVLIKARKKQNWSQATVAFSLNISKSTYCLIERGKRNPSLAVADRMEDLFGIPQRKLLQLDYNETKGELKDATGESGTFCT